jgi:hypothetical protein
MEIFAFGLLFWLPLCIAVGILADRYKRGGIAWFFVSVCLSPIIGGAFVLALGPANAKPVQLAGYQPTTGDSAPGNPPDQGTAATYRGSRFRPAF